MPAICYYITGHGLGHATRSLGIIKSLLDNGATVCIISTMDSSFFDINLNQYHAQIKYFRKTIDSGAIQSSPLEVDPIATLNQYYNCIHLVHEQILQEEVKFLNEEHPSLIIVDVAALPCRAADLAGIPSLILSNFTWDYCYKMMLATVENQIDPDLANEYKNMVLKCEEDYLFAKYFIRLPGATPLSSHIVPTSIAANQIQVMDGPMICRKANDSRMNVRKEFNIPDDVYAVVLGFGGFKLSENFSLLPSYLPPNWVCLVLGSDGSDLPNDTIVINDVKLGYGTVSECLAHKIPLIYVPRSSWPEEEFLKNFMETYDALVEMPETELFEGKWHSYLALALKKKHSSWSIEIENAIDEVVSKIMSFCLS
eukprot:gene12134-16245_t